MPPVFKGLSITHATLLVVGAALILMQAIAVIFDSVTEWRETRVMAEQRARAAIDMLEAVHTGAMLNRQGIDDGDPAVATLDGAMKQFSESHEGIRLWLVMAPKLLAYQSAHGREREPPRDKIDRQALASAQTTKAIINGSLRETRPVILGEGHARHQRCISCHARLLGDKPGEVIGAFSAAVDLGPAIAFWRGNTIHHIVAGIGITLIILGVTIALLIITTLRPLRNLTAATQRLATGNLDSAVAHTKRRDELGMLARSLEIFRTGLLEKRRSEEKIAHMTRHDLLTGLPNRACFNDHIDRAIEESGKTCCKIAAIVIDIERLSEINDVHGHVVGDTVLKTLSDAMVGMLAEGECVARIGGDEFAALKAFSEQSALLGFVARLESCIVTTLVIDGLDIRTAAHIGVAIYPDDAADKDELMSKASIAMQRAKAGARQTTCFYEAAMDEAARSRRRLVDDLWGAIERDELSLAYQVQKTLRTLQTTGYEALLRWHHPELGSVSPARFIPLAEDCGAIVPIGEWVLRTACAEAAGWPHPYRIAINLSPLQLADRSLPERVHDILMETGLPPARLELEITESAIISDKDQARAILHRIKEMGVAIALDDFGTGYSSLDTLRSFPFDKVKVDRCFVKELGVSPQADAILRAVVALGHGLGIPVLAEGVETVAQLDLLKAERCDEGQGYLFGRPQPAVAFEAEIVTRAC